MKPKRNFWPLGIFLAIVAFIGGNVAFVMIACSSKTELVSKDYYDREIKYQSRIDSETRTAQLATRATVGYDEAAKAVVISLPTEHAGKAESGEIGLYCPSAAGEDRSFKLAPDARGAQTLDVSAMAEGLYRIHLTWNVAGEEYFFDQKLVIGPASMQARLAELNQPASTLRN